jgi:carbon starvation protein CstA
VLGPAKLLAKISGLEASLWVGAIFAYYFLATILPIDKIIGRIYPVF